MGRTRLTLRTLLGLTLAALAGLAAAVPASMGAPGPRPASGPPHVQVKQQPKRCRATRRHRCAQRAPRPPVRPAVSTGPARSVSASVATLTAKLKIRSHSATYWFQYGPTTAYGNQTGARSALRGNALTVSARVGGLAAGGTYHYRVTASSCNGCATATAYGSDVTFIAGGYADPVFSASASADPSVLDTGDTHSDYWAFVTGDRFPTRHSGDLVHWAGAGTAMATRPSWVSQTADWHAWAPSVLQIPGPCPDTGSTTCFVMYYTGLSATFNVNCVAVATSTAPGGPYIDRGPLSNGGLDSSGRPLGCGDDHGYNLIDPSPFRDRSGRAYLYVTADSACSPPTTSCTASNGHPQPTISVTPLSADYLSAAGPRTPLFAGDPGTWESVGLTAPTVEGPAMVYRNGTYYLLYSGGNFRGAYGMGYATGASPTGPFTKSVANPILSQTASVFSPGGADDPVIGPHGGTWLVYHGREGSPALPRLLRIEPLGWRGQAYGPDAPLIGQPTDAPQGFAP